MYVFFLSSLLSKPVYSYVKPFEVPNRIELACRTVLKKNNRLGTYNKMMIFNYNTQILKKLENLKISSVSQAIFI